MENWSITLLVIAGLLVGFLGHMAVTNPEIVEVEVPVIEIQEKIVEVPIEVCGELCECPECEVGSITGLLDLAVEDFMKAVENEEVKDINLLKFNGTGHEYDFDEISIRKVYDAYNVTFLDDDEYLIDFEIKLKYKEDGESSEKIIYTVNVHYKEDEDTEVIVYEDTEITPQNLE